MANGIPTEVLSLIVPALVALVVTGAGFLANRKLGIAPAQQSLVKTLQDTVVAMKDSVATMTTEFTGCKTRLAAVELHNDELKQDLFELRLTLTQAKKTRKKGVIGE